MSFDKSHGLRSARRRLGAENALAAAFLAHIIMCGCCWRSGCFAIFASRISSAGHHCRLPCAGTLDCAAAQFELDQPRVLRLNAPRRPVFFSWSSRQKLFFKAVSVALKFRLTPSVSF